VRAGILRLWKDGIDGDVLSELDDSIREDIIDGLDAAELAVAVRDLDSDDVVDLLEDLDEPQQEAILGALDDAERVVVEQSLSFPEESAGRLMQREVVMAPEHWNVGQAIDYLRRQEDLPEQFLSYDPDRPASASHGLCYTWQAFGHQARDADA